MGEERIDGYMQHNFQYVPSSEYLPVKKELDELIHVVQDEMRDYFTFSVTYVGSSKRKLITEDKNGNIGYDFDVNIHVNDDDEEYSAQEIRSIITNALNKHVKEY